MKTFLLIAFALLISTADNLRAEVTFGNAGPGKDGRTYRYVTFRVDIKTSMATKLNQFDDDWRAKVILAADGQVTISGINPAETKMFLAGQISNKPDNSPDIGLTWKKEGWQPMKHLGNGVYEVTVPLLDGATYDYKFVTSDLKDRYGAWTKDPDNPIAEKSYGNSRVTVSATTSQITR